MQFQLIDIILIVSAVQLVIFDLFLIKKKHFSDSNKILAFFLLIQIILLTNVELLRFKDLITGAFTHLLHTGTPFYLLPAPTFYLYIKSRVYKDFSFTRKDFFHIVPFILAILFMSFTFYFSSIETKQLIIQNHSFISNSFIVAFNIIFVIQFLIYFAADLIILKSYRKEIKQYYSSVDSINLSWISYLLYLFMIAFFSNLSAFIIRFYLPDLLTVNLFITNLLFFIFFNYIYYKGLSNPEIFTGIESKQKYVSSNLSRLQSDQYLLALQTYMEKEKPYLNSGITLKDLSEQVSISHRYLSQIINENLHQNFYDFISKYRIEEAKRLLKVPDNKTILEILYIVGFNSKSSFNSAFKKFTGTTPSKFKNQTDDTVRE